MCCPGVGQEKNSCLNDGNPGEVVSWQDFGEFFVDFSLSFHSFFLQDLGEQPGWVL